MSTPDPETGQLLDAETIRNQVLMHLSNGFNGPSITGAWLAYLLATHPDVEAKLIAEIDAITGGDPDYDLQYDDLFNLTYTTQVIKETMRIYPPQPVTIRRSLKDGMLGRYRVRKDDIILVGTLAAQRDPRYWGPDPDTVRSGAVRDREGRGPAAARLHPVLGRQAAVHGARGHVHDAPRRPVRDLPALPAAARAGRHGDQEHRRDHQAGRGADHRSCRGSGRASTAAGRRPSRERRTARAPAAAPERDWGDPTQIPETSAYRHLVIAYGSNFGANKMLAEHFAERADFQGYTSDVITLNELAAAPPRTRPWLLVVMTSTYTSNAPSNAAEFKTWLERTPPGTPTWQNCRYLVWGLGNSQWNAFLAFPRYVYAKLSELGATPLGEFAYGDVGTPVWERRHDEWNAAVWPVLLELSGARRTEAAAARVAAGNAATGALTGTDSQTAMHRSLYGGDVPGQPAVPVGQRPLAHAPHGAGVAEAAATRAAAARPRRGSCSPRPSSPTPSGRTPSRPAPWLAGAPGRAVAQADQAPRTRPAARRHLPGRRPPRHLPEERRGAGRMAGPAPRRRTRRPVHGAEDGERPRGAEGRRPAGPQRAHQPRRHQRQADRRAHRPHDREGGRPGELSRLIESGRSCTTPDGPASPLRAAIDAGGYDVLGLLYEFPSCPLNIYEFLQVAQPLKPRYYSTSSSRGFTATASPT